MQISLKFIPKGPINNIPALIQIMAWRRPGDKPLSEPMMVSLLTHICVTRPQRVKCVQERNVKVKQSHQTYQWCDVIVIVLGTSIRVVWVLVKWRFQLIDNVVFVSSEWYCHFAGKANDHECHRGHFGKNIIWLYVISTALVSCASCAYCVQLTPSTYSFVV